VKAMKFVAMQPKKNIDRVCDALPDTGPTVIALDAPDVELREMNWDIRILRDTGGVQDAEADAVFRLPVQKFRNGMANFDHNFAQAGKYILFVKMTSDDGATDYLGRHYFTVGLMDDAEVYAYVLLAGFLLTTGGGFAFFAQRRRKSATRSAFRL